MSERERAEAIAAGGLPPEAEIGAEEAIALGAVIADVRAPEEFAEDHIPGARNVPLFGDRERAVVGTLFRHRGAEQAREWGESRVRARLEPFIGALRAALELPGERGDAERPRRARVICCARGGERSAAVTALLRDLGDPVRRLRGGYRSYREQVRARLGRLEVHGPVLLDGWTGCGKTAVLRRVARLHPRRVLDLEALAGHRSSLLGGIGLVPASQKRFESALVAAVDRLEGPWTLIEAESRRVGDREIPASLFRAMRAAPRIELDATTEERIAHLRADYLGEDEEGADPAARLAEVADRLGALAAYEPIGPAGVGRLRGLLAAGRIDEAVRILLELHYDPRYRHGNRGVVPVDRIRLGGEGIVAQGREARIDRAAEDLVRRLDRLVARVPFGR